MRGHVRSLLRTFVKRSFPHVVHMHNLYTNWKFKGTSPEHVFHEIHDANAWASTETRSGLGSESNATRELVKNLRVLLDAHGLRSVLDVPCGDFNWMRFVDLTGLSYIGGDIIEALVNHNIEKYAMDSCSFRRLDVVTDELPSSDVLLCRDCFVHFSFRAIQRSFDNITQSGIPYILMTHYGNASRNYDIETGGWRKINFEIAPFFLPAPIDYIDEKCEEGYYFADKMLGLWNVADLALSIAE